MKLLIYGKLTFLLCIIAFMQVQASAFAQLITLKVRDTSVEEVLKELKNKAAISCCTTMPSWRPQNR